MEKPNNNEEGRSPQNPQADLQPENQKKTAEKQNKQYFNEYCKLYLSNFVLSLELKQLQRRKNQLISKCTQLLKTQKQLDGVREESESSGKKKKTRRTATEIHRVFKCTVDNCTRSYGSLGSLHQHIKLKHPEIYPSLKVEEAVKEENDELI